jgi:hypothetical protein
MAAAYRFPQPHASTRRKDRDATPPPICHVHVGRRDCAAERRYDGRDASARTMPPFTLTDQDGRARTIDYPRDKVSVFVIADHKGSSEIAGWITPLYQRYQQRCRDRRHRGVTGIPRCFRDCFRREFKKRLAFPVMLDWTGDVSRSMGYENNRAQLLVVSRSGRVALTKSGPAHEQALAEVIGAIDRLRANP